MSSRTKVRTRDSTKSPFEPRRGASAFEPRAFAPLAQETAEASSAELFDAYVQRMASLELVRSQELAAEAAPQARRGGLAAPSQMKGAENRTGMPDSLKSGLEQLSERDLSDVRVHYNSPRPAQVAALAYTQGPDIHVSPGQERHLPHEGWHAVQQMEGRVRPTLHAHGVAINDDRRLEREADVMGSKALQTRRRPE